MALRMFNEKATGFVAKMYQRTLGNQLQQYGLRYEDILNEDEAPIKQALELADPEVLIGRQRRVKRAIDLNFKRKNFQDYAPNMEIDIFKSELYDDVQKVKAREQEIALLNAHNK
uniref:Cytochrome b-c1 complex subunit 7 n=1 Tax=Eucampia antarctica TaxID=49252 RepID=A0A6U0QZL7_9STRA|mmetsp:Transcript_17787/g.17177  ORF Transcript_17787/g.17177 Transcript_17787/m.17177 type:complete len:115 (+) Transcript_17787:25-369(+)|eukprot:CAMPEP_0197840060 /NCGR_PEP_ID=MMETSP1437-20131217/45387_1 /TAXON_ID=49252 ORGANISM="Eucampia antarctica, Strain CCMP1452" /NCGR_SAMPLE_ID=MMETSP1437 /ASSEMBLY_ACC=CAM_ASM_001096 /LENGTH=114 /DNA_ID=CAMNT_0043449609 /DNA_START=25 /DNA_END=369 /DNA_ORIENTATION=-